MSDYFVRQIAPKHYEVAKFSSDFKAPEVVYNVKGPRNLCDCPAAHRPRGDDLCKHHWLVMAWSCLTPTEQHTMYFDDNDGKWHEHPFGLVHLLRPYFEGRGT